MAQLKSTVVQGNLSVTDDSYLNGQTILGGHLILPGVASGSTANTTQIIFKSGSTEYATISAVTSGSILINPSSSSTTGQIELKPNSTSKFTSSTASSSKTTGALVVNGGVGIGGIVHTGANLYTQGSVIAGTFTANTAQSVEVDVMAQSGAGKIFLYSHAATTGNIGIYSNNAAGTAKGIFFVRQAQDLFFQLQVSFRTSAIATADYSTTAFQIREYNYDGAQTDSWEYAPRMGFYWSGRTTAQIGLASNGHLYECPTTGTTFYRILTSYPYSSVSSSWHKGRDNALLRYGTLTSSHYFPSLSFKTTNGSWDIGTYSNASYDNYLLFSYITDTLYSGTTSSYYGQIRFQPGGGIIAVQTAGIENHFIARATGYSNSATLDVKLMVGSGKTNHGVYSTGYSADGTAFTSDGKWMVYRNSAGNIILNGNAQNVTGTVAVDHGGTNATTAAGARANLGTWALVSDSYNTLMPADGTTNHWIKFGTSNTSYGILPSAAGGAGSGHNYIGTSTWYWKYAYIDEIVAGSTITLAKDKWQSNSTYGLHANNSDVIGVNSLRFADSAETFAEGIMFPNGTGFDCIAPSSGTFFFRAATDGSPSLSVANSTAQIACGGLIINQPAAARNKGVIGTYDYTKAALIWSMGSSYNIAADGSGLGNLYGAAYGYQGQACLGSNNYAGGHQFLWCQNGAVYVALGSTIWTSTQVIAGTFAANTAQTAEADITAQSGAGKIYLYSTAATTGNRGIWALNAAGTGASIMVLDQSNNTIFSQNVYFDSGQIVIRHGTTPMSRILFGTRAQTNTYTMASQNEWGDIFYFAPAKNNSDNTWFNAGFIFRQYSYTASSTTRLSYYEDYYFPRVTTGLSSSPAYNVLTSKGFTGTSTSWHKGRDGAQLRMSTINNYSAVLSIKTSSGSWDIGAYDNTSYTNQLLFSYVSDTQYAGTTSSVTAQVRFSGDGRVLAPATSLWTGTGTHSTAGNIAGAIQAYWNSNKTNATLLPRHPHGLAIATNHSNAAMAFGYFIPNYNDTPYGGFFAALYNTPYYIGIQNGTFNQQRILTDYNATSAFKIITWSYTYTTSAPTGNDDNSTRKVEISQANFGIISANMTTKGLSGWIPISFVRIVTGSQQMVIYAQNVRACHASYSAEGRVIGLRNVGSTAVTSKTCTIEVLYVKGDTIPVTT